MKRKVKLVIADIDDTLVNKNKQMMPLTKQMLIKLHNDGVLLGIASGRPCGEHLYSRYKGWELDFQFDVNGDKLPNKFGRDKFVFFMCFSDAERQIQCSSSTKAFCTPKYGARTREDFIVKCKQQPSWCSSLLECDNWGFRSDYPYRL